MAILLSKFKDLLQTDANENPQNATTPVASLLNKQIDGLKLAKSLFDGIEEKRSAVTALTREDAQRLKNNVQLTSIKHESRINAIYRLVGLPSEIELQNTQNVSFLNATGNPIASLDSLKKTLLDREYEQLSLYLNNMRLQADSVDALNKQLDNAEAQGLKVIADLFDPTKMVPTRLFPAIQFSSVAACAETVNRIAPVFASTNEKYINGGLLKSPFLESVITIRLLPQSGGSAVNETGAVEDAIISAMAFAFVDLSRKFNKNQADAEKLIIDGIAKVRPTPPSGINNTALAKSGDADAGTRDPNSPKVEIDQQTDNLQAQITLYDDINALLPLENDVIPTGNNILGTPLTTTNIKDNALTGAFLSAIGFNLDALNRVSSQTSQMIKKRQAVQDKLTAEIGSIIQNVGGISMAEILIIITALFLLDEEDLVGLIPVKRFNQVINASNTAQTSANTINDNGSVNTPQRQINIYDVLKTFKNSRHDTNTALKNLQDLILEIYNDFIDLLKKSHHI